MKQDTNTTNSRRPASKAEIIADFKADLVNMIRKSHLSYNQAESLFGEVLESLKSIPYQPQMDYGVKSDISKEKPFGT